MRITGMVIDAVVAAEDGRNRHDTTNPHGHYGVKTDWDPMNLSVSAPGYVTRSVPVADTDRFPVVNIELEPLSLGATAPRVDYRAPKPAGSRPTAESRIASKLRELQALHERGMIT